MGASAIPHGLCRVHACVDASDEGGGVGGAAAVHKGRAAVEPRGWGGEGEGEEWGGIRWGGQERAQKRRWGRQGGAGGRLPPP